MIYFYIFYILSIKQYDINLDISVNFLREICRILKID